MSEYTASDPPRRARSPWWTLIVALIWFFATAYLAEIIAYLTVPDADDADEIMPVWLVAALSLMLLPAVLATGAGASLRAGIRHAWAIPLALVATGGAAWLMAELGIGHLGADAPTPAEELATLLHFPVRSALAVLLLAPVAEELFYRGWLWERLRERWSVPVVGLVTGLLFALSHSHAVLVILPGALALTLVRIHCGGLRASMLLHAANNLLAILLRWDG